MRYYKDIILQEDGTRKADKYHYHEWSPESITSYWDICTNNPFIRRQFYPIDYWEDLLAWSNKRMTTESLAIVDVGCGTGNVIRCLSKIYKRAAICGVDLSEHSLGPARERFKRNDHIRFRVGSLDSLPFEDDSVDLLTCTEVLEHTSPSTFEKSFYEVSRVLNKGGYYLASVPFAQKVTFVCCPECRSVFTPHQHMIFEISQADLSRLLSANSLRLIGWYTSVDRSKPSNPVKKIVKPIIIRWFPRFSKRIFPRAGVSGFLAAKKL